MGPTLSSEEQRDTASVPELGGSETLWGQFTPGSVTQQGSFWPPCFLAVAWIAACCSEAQDQSSEPWEITGGLEEQDASLTPVVQTWELHQLGMYFASALH